MKLKEIVAEKAILPDLQATERDEVITELIGALVDAGAADAAIRDELIAKVLQREAAGSTGFGRGVAVPHVKHADATQMAAAIGVSRKGIDFNSLDKQPVYSVVLLVSPLDRPEEHLQAMEVIFKNLSKDTFRRFLRQAETVEDVLTLLDEADNQQLA
ncbi:MAG: PTS sugar transporter subunit IIA [Phycisphaerales bacterium JB039]